MDKQKISEIIAAIEDSGIEYYAFLDYRDCREYLPRLISRQGITPRSVLVYLLPYYTGDTVNISRYAASLDYHLAISEVNSKITEAIAKGFPDYRSVGYGDHSPIDERHAALTAGLGIAGKNGLVINEAYGNYVFVADIVTDIPPEELPITKPQQIKGCHACGACLRACPTGILRGEGDSCLSAITQKKGELTREECELMRKYNTAWGCDICQYACPHNIDSCVTPIVFFHEDRIALLTSEVLDSLDDESFEKRAFAWRKRSYLRLRTSKRSYS